MLQMSSDHRFPAGYYRLHGGEQHLFVKIVPCREAARLRAAERVAAFVCKGGIQVNCQLPGYPRPAGGDYLLFASPYIEGTFYQGEAQQAASVGKALAHLHRILRRCPWRKAIRRRGLGRQRKLRDRLHLIRRGQVDGIPTAALSILEKVDDHLLERLCRDAQVIHGDLNAGNILFAGHHRRPVFLDFEDTPTAWFSPLTDLAYLLERLALCSSSSPTTTAEHLLRAYYAAGGMRFISAAQLNQILQALAVRALLLLAEKSALGRSSTTEEWQKFIILHHAATQHDPRMTALIARLRDT